MPVADWYTFSILRWSFAFHLCGPAGGLALLAAIGSVAVAQPRADDALARTRVDVREAPWSSVGKLQAVAGSVRRTCTAALVGSRTVLSSAHCIFNIRMQSYFLPSSIHFVAGLEGGQMAFAGTGYRVTTGSGYDPGNPRATAGSDWALIELAAPADRVVPLSFAPKAPKIGTSVVLGGYARENPNVMTADTSCKVIGYTADAHGRRLILHDCDGEHGVSGAPLMADTEHGWRIVGVNAGRADQRIGFAVATEQIEPYLR